MMLFCIYLFERKNFPLQINNKNKQQVKNMANNRAFFDIIEKTGASGKYQDLSLVFWSLCFLTSGASSYFNAFLFYQEDYVCSQGMENCAEYVCSLSPTQRLNFIDPKASTFLSKFGDYRCDSTAQIDAVQSFIYMGGLFGVLMGSFINEYISKKRLLLLTVILNIVGVVLAILGNSLYLASAGLFLNFAAKSIQPEVIPCIITETVSQQKRGKHVMVGYIFYGLGVTLNGAVFMLIKNWIMALLLYQLVPFMILLWGFYFFIEETPFDSIVYDSPQQSLKTFQKIAELNGETDHGITLQTVQTIKRQYEENQNSKHSSVISIIDLFRYDSLRTMAIVSIILQLFISYQFNVPQLIIKDYALNIYLSGIILGASQVLASIFCYFLINGFKRKQLINVVQILAILTSAPIFFFASCNQSVDQCGVLSSVIQISGIFLFRFFVSIGYNIFYMAQFQMFPTQIRSLAIQFTSSICTIAVIMTPHIQSFFKAKGVSIIITFSISCVLIILAAIKMPETYNTIPPEIIQELKCEDQTNIKESITPPQKQSTK